MRRVDFTLDGSGPYAGMMCFGRIGDGEVEFIAIPLSSEMIMSAETIRIMPEDDDAFEVPIEKAVVVESSFDQRDDCASGYITFETI